MKANDFVARLEKLLSESKLESVKRLCEAQVSILKFTKTDFPAEQAKQALALLRKHRQFAAMLALAEGFLYRSDLYEVHQIHRQYGQALIEQGHLVAAIHTLGVAENALREDTDEESVAEWKELVGLLGRAHKQLYVQRKVPDDLRTALGWYHFVYFKEPEVWHGINVATLAWRADKEGIDLADPIDFRQIATSILQVIDKKPDPQRSHWDMATAAEALAVLEQPEAAIPYLIQYCDHPQADAFALASTLRQFDEILDLDEGEGACLILIDILRTSLMGKAQGKIVAGARKVAAIGKDTAARVERVEVYEKRFTNAGPLPRSWFLHAVERARRVGRVWRQQYWGCGTGFLLDDGAVLHEPWSGYQIFVTCNHVISTIRPDPSTLHPDDATITFDALEGLGTYEPRRYKVKTILWESPPDDLDVTILQLDEREDRLDTTTHYSVTSDCGRMPCRPDQRIYIIGHPNGGEMSYSFQDNYFVEANQRRIQYFTPTDPGSSGSPVFDQDLQLIAIHHAGSEHMPMLSHPKKTHKANEGIPMPAIIEALKNS